MYVSFVVLAISLLAIAVEPMDIFTFPNVLVVLEEATIEIDVTFENDVGEVAAPLTPLLATPRAEPVDSKSDPAVTEVQFAADPPEVAVHVLDEKV